MIRYLEMDFIPSWKDGSVTWSQNVVPEADVPAVLPNLGSGGTRRYPDKMFGHHRVKTGLRRMVKEDGDAIVPSEETQNQ